MSTTPRADLWFSICLIAFGLAALIESWRMPRLTELGIDPLSAPGLTPGILALVITVLGIAVCLRSIGTAPDGDVSAQGGWGRLAGALVLCLAYALGLVGRVDFMAATAAFVFAFAAFFTPAGASLGRRLGGSAILAAAASVTITLIFERIFLIRLP